jgi:hypothetical protein
MTRSFETKLKNVADWLKIVDYHWDRLLGEYNNDTQFWDDVFHSMEAEDWWDVVDVAKALQIQHPEELDRFPRFGLHLEQVERRLHRCDPVIKQWNRQGYNIAATALLMSVRDALNEIAGKPTKRWSEKDKAKIRSDQEANQFLTLFQIDLPNQ